jgi:hypothetical protein
LKLLRDVARSSAPRLEPWVPASQPWYDDDDDSDSHGYYGEEVGMTDCCDWHYSAHARDRGLIRHHSYCNSFNPQGLNEF